jgi:hypothetical protein
VTRASLDFHEAEDVFVPSVPRDHHVASFPETKLCGFFATAAGTQVTGEVFRGQGLAGDPIEDANAAWVRRPENMEILC